MAKPTIEIGQRFHKSGSPWIVWTVSSFVENTMPMHVHLIRTDDPTTNITLSLNVLEDPRYFQRIVGDS